MSTKFSIVITVHAERYTELSRSLRSLASQTYQDFEIIIVDDALKKPEMVMGLVLKEGVWNKLNQVIRFESRHERVITRNAGIRAAGEDTWICWLDSDDEWLSVYLEIVNDAIADNPEARLFNFGSIVMWRRRLPTFTADGQPTKGGTRYTRTGIRKPTHFEWDEEKGQHVEFKSGKLGAGMFVYHKSVLDEIGYLPEAKNPYDFHQQATDVHHLYPPDGVTLGNPWGDDYLMFYRLTRKFRSYPLDVILYLQHVRV